MAFDPLNLLSPVAPGLSGAVNPLAFIGAGMAQGNPLGALNAMGGLQLQAQRQNQALLALHQRQAMIAEQMAMRRQQMADQNAMALSKMLAPTTLQKNLDWAMSLPEGDPRREAAMASLTRPATTVNMGSIPTGLRNVGTPEEPRFEPIRGSEQDISRRKEVAALEDMLTVISELEGLVQQHGTEAVGDIADEMTGLRQRYIGNINLLRQTGVLQEGELKRLEQELPDPTGLGGMFTRTGSVLTKFGGARREVQDKLGNLREIYGMPTPTTSGQPGEDTGAAQAAPGGPPGLKLPPGWRIERVK